VQAHDCGISESINEEALMGSYGDAVAGATA